MAPSLTPQSSAVEPADNVVPAVLPVVNTVADGDMLVPSARTDRNSSHPVEKLASQISIPQMPPAYGEDYDHLDINNDGFATQADVADDGRININIDQRSRRLSNLLAPVLKSHLELKEDSDTQSSSPPSTSSTDAAGEPLPPPLNIVMHVVGSRGDVQPFVALGKILVDKYNHRVRLATHPTFKHFVEENGLEFFSISGDPAELMAFMVKNPSLVPDFETLRNGEIGSRRKGMYEIMKGCWRSCIEAGDGMGVPPSEDYVEDYATGGDGVSTENSQMTRPFIADAIIANPPSYAHMHCAEKLGIPLHIMFTMPWSPTQAFPHPLANILSSNADSSLTNYISYALVEMMTWQGLGDVINRFRERSLALEPVSLMWAPGMASRLRIPHTYCWSPALIPKPKDWGPHITVSGFYFLSLASSFQPDSALKAFLDAGPPPVYIGFGSIVLDDPNAMTKTIFEAVSKAGVRALVSKGWGGVGANEMGIPKNVMMLGNVPHDWLFKHVSCVVHHGGAGTTAAGVALGKPTVVVPFFGDQPFWGAMIARAGAGPEPIPHKDLDSDKLAAAILIALQPAVRDRATLLSQNILSEKGTEVGAQRFHENLQFDQLRCSLSPSRAAAWRVKRTNIRLSPLAATVLAKAGLLDFNDLKFYRPREYEVEDGPWGPVSGGASALLGTIGSLMMGVADFPVEILKTFRSKAEEGGTEEHRKQHRSTLSDSFNRTRTPTSITSSPNGPESSLQSPVASQVCLPEPTSTQATSVSSPLLHPTSALESHSDQRWISTDSLAASSGRSTQSAMPSSNQPSLPLDREFQTQRIPSRSSCDGERTSSNLSAPGYQPTAMAQALAGRLRHVSNSKEDFGSNSPAGKRSCSPAGRAPFEAVVGAGKGVARIVEVGLKSPMNFTLALARGFHNAPKLYGDDTVRNPDKVTGFKSGLKTAGKEFGLGFYDGITGLITQPIKGAKHEGPAGFAKGLYKGIGGLVLKPGAAIWSVPGYTFRGIYKEIQKHFGSSVHNYIYAARTAQGIEAYDNSSRKEHEHIIKAWHSAEDDLEKAKSGLREDARRKVLACKSIVHPSTQERERLAQQAKASRKAHEAVVRGELPGVDPETLYQAHPYPSTGGHGINNEQLEEAIKKSVAATSRGDSEEDEKIERAIRSSVADLLSARGNEVSGPEALDRAVSASVLEATLHRVPERSRLSGVAKDRGVEVVSGDARSSHDNSLSLANHSPVPRKLHFDAEGSNKGEYSDEDMQRAMNESEEHARIAAGKGTGPPMADDPELQKVLKESLRSHEEHERVQGQARMEEDIVLDYIKKQTLAEQEFREDVQRRPRQES